MQEVYRLENVQRVPNMRLYRNGSRGYFGLVFGLGASRFDEQQVVCVEAQQFEVALHIVGLGVQAPNAGGRVFEGDGHEIGQEGVGRVACDGGCGRDQSGGVGDDGFKCAGRPFK